MTLFCSSQPPDLWLTDKRLPLADWHTAVFETSAPVTFVSGRRHQTLHVHMEHPLPMVSSVSCGWPVMAGFTNNEPRAHSWHRESSGSWTQALYTQLTIWTPICLTALVPLQARKIITDLLFGFYCESGSFWTWLLFSLMAHRNRKTLIY